MNCDWLYTLKFLPAVSNKILSLASSSKSPGRDDASSKTFDFVPSRIESRRRRTTKGRTTLPYSDCLKSPRRVSAIDQTSELNDLISLSFSLLLPNFHIFNLINIKEDK